MELSDLDGADQELFDSLASDSDPEWLQALALSAVDTWNHIVRLRSVLDGDRETWMQLTDMRDGDIVLQIDGAMAEIRNQKTVFRQLIAEIRRHSDSSGPVASDDADDLAGMPG